MELGLQGKTAIVTGGTKGLGAGICEVLALEGMNIVTNYLSDEKTSREFEKDIEEKTGMQCKSYYADVSKAKDIENIISKAEQEFGNIDVLVNNAGIWPTTPIQEISDEDWENVIDVNLNGAFMFSKRVVNHFLKNNIKGHIINITSKSGFTVSSPDHAHYVTSKGGLNLMTKAFAREFAKKGITVNGVTPGMVRTPINEDKLSQKEWLKYYEDRIPVGRVATSKEVGYTVAFLASEKAQYICGCMVDVTGGMLI